MEATIQTAFVAYLGERRLTSRCAYNRETLNGDGYRPPAES